MMYLEFTLSETMEQFLSCHRRALEFFGQHGEPAPRLANGATESIQTFS